VVYDITKEKSFRDVRSWVTNVRENADPGVEILLLGNKNDLPDRQVTRAQGQQLAQELGAHFEEISALDGNVNVLFERLCAGTAPVG
jgi:GTPase SAR1 family protein